MAKRENMRALAAFLRVTHLQSRRYSEILEVFVYEDCQTLKQLMKVIENHIGPWASCLDFVISWDHPKG
jgi:hypothetical protein